jgi:alkylhydroperoxidase/carboxymuconolactone decarboxylase family protein YurZ
MAYDDTLIVDHIQKTHDTELLSEREKYFVGLAVTMTRGCQVCTRNRIEKARGIGISDEELNALVAVTAAVNNGVTAATARVACGMLEEDDAPDCGGACSPEPGKTQG